MSTSRARVPRPRDYTPNAITPKVDAGPCVRDRFSCNGGANAVRFGGKRAVALPWRGWMVVRRGARAEKATAGADVAPACCIAWASASRRPSSFAHSNSALVACTGGGCWRRARASAFAAARLRDCMASRASRSSAEELVTRARDSGYEIVGRGGLDAGGTLVADGTGCR